MSQIVAETLIAFYLVGVFVLAGRGRWYLAITWPITALGQIIDSVDDEISDNGRAR